MNAEQYKVLLDKLIEMMDEGIYIVDREGYGIHYNSKMASLEKMNKEDVLGKEFHVAFPEFRQGESTVFRALTKNQPTLKKQQTYKNFYGKEITTVNSTVPVVVNGETVAAIEISKDITDFRNISDAILELREEAADKARNGEKAKTAYLPTMKNGVRRYSFSDIYGEDPALKATIDRALKAANGDASVFIYGETGTGKELFAQSIHFAGSRADKPFLAQNCAAIPETLLEGILFGTAKGAFTGAVDRAGLFEQANGGTLLLDEISAMPLELQAKLLRVLQERYIRRIGGTRDIPVDVRIIATVNEDPQELMSRGTLRKDLYYRLAVVNLSIPPLRERKSDIPGLVNRFLEKFNKRFSKQVWRLTDEAMIKLQSYEFPGNIRELENFIEQAVSLSDNENVLGAEHINIPYQRMKIPEPELSYSVGAPLDEYLAELESRIISSAIVRSGGNVSKAADDLGIRRQTLQHKLKKYSIPTK